jgi:hypothetical protein
MYLFTFAFLGNSFYVASILTSSEAWAPAPKSQNFLRESLPSVLVHYIFRPFVDVIFFLDISWVQGAPLSSTSPFCLNHLSTRARPLIAIIEGGEKVPQFQGRPSQRRKQACLVGDVLGSASGSRSRQPTILSCIPVI